MPEHDYVSGVHSRATGKKRACRNVILKQYMEMGFMMNRCRNAFFMNSLGTRHFTKRGGPRKLCANTVTAVLIFRAQYQSRFTINFCRSAT